MKLKGHQVAVVGLGKSGYAAARFLIRSGAFVRVTDAGQSQVVIGNANKLRQLGARIELGRHSDDFLEGSELLVRSPGVPEESLPLRFAKKKAIPVISEIELAGLFCRGTVVAVTGSNGKTTTCCFLHQVLLNDRRKSVLCGNIGNAFLGALGRIDRRTVVVLELSSFQLEECFRFRPKVSVVLNLCPNHLDRHKSMRRYVAAKERIFRSQKSGDAAVLNNDDPLVRAMSRKTRCRTVLFSKKAKTPVRIDGESVRVQLAGRAHFSLSLKKMKLRGAHNRENIMAAVAAAALIGVSPRAIQRTIDTFRPVEHRIERLGAVNGITFVNDSKSTTIGSTRAALEATPAPIVLVCGGRDKGAPFERIEPLVRRKVRRAALYGEARKVIAAAWRSFGSVQLVGDFRRAVRNAFRTARPGETLLLSPMCTSFDQFNSYEERGKAFKEVFAQIKAESKQIKRSLV